ncbi:hypothetical protein KM043_018288 [Ampulex compressa]|nr:hypothetical protein KM043_018288 [Ampulex compressa]
MSTLTKNDLVMILIFFLLKSPFYKKYWILNYIRYLLHVINVFELASVFIMKQGVLWRRNLYENCGLPDNYTDDTFLEQLRKNIKSNNGQQYKNNIYGPWDEAIITS